ncbi:MAG TPA: hypothetical protein VFO93_13900 [Hymenobacter sp.]|uniref:hypothetical protein n=1 Tax=Hymenobacter sp. TaxID=1898978 RepID=UPI002D7F848C|nr:hypothetical protein [Hymenobacter sp.]HET9504630.1 hypothetical protein [Hymenobacter sp.]
MQKVLVFALATALLAGRAQDQTHPAARPGTTPAKRPAATARKPAARPVAKPTPAPATRPQVVVSAPVARPVAAAPAAAAPAAAPAPRAAGSPAAFGKNSNAVNLGLGFGLGYGVVGSGATSLPALSASYMRGVAAAGPGTISVGGLVGYKTYTWSYGGDKSAWRHVFLGARGAYHYGFGNPRLDTYAGVGLGLRLASYAASQSSGSVSDGSQLELSGLVGARYYFTHTVGAFAELGYDMSLLKIGASARF